MAERLNFEEVAERFSGCLRQPSVSHCDWVVIKDKEIIFIEETDYSSKDFANPRVYSKEVIENVKKMWGSYAILLWYLQSNSNLETLKGKRKLYIISLEQIDNRTSRILSNLLKTLEKYKNGIIDEVGYIAPTP